MAAIAMHLSATVDDLAAFRYPEGAMAESVCSIAYLSAGKKINVNPLVFSPES
jgi:hypothetical protein